MHFNKNKHFIFPSRRISFLPWKVHFPLPSHTRLGPQQGVDIKLQPPHSETLRHDYTVY